MDSTSSFKFFERQRRKWNDHSLNIAYSGLLVEEFQDSKLSFLSQQLQTHEKITMNRAVFLHFVELQSMDNTNEVDLEFLNTLLENGADINYTDKYGQTVLHEVARNWHVDVARFLLFRGANANSPDIYGRTPLHVAAAVNYVEMIKLLLDRRGHVESATYGELQTPMHYAAKHNAVEAILCLYSHQATLHSRDFQRRTPLFLAVINSYSRAAMQLLRMGSSATVEDSLGYSCIMEMIIKTPSVASYALSQLYIIDEVEKKQHFYLKYLTPDSKAATLSIAENFIELFPLCLTENEPISYRTLLEFVHVNNCYQIVEHPVLKKLIDLKWRSYGLNSNHLLFLMNLVFLVSWSALLFQKQWMNYQIFLKSWWMASINLFCILEIIYLTAWKTKEFVTSRNKLLRWKSLRKEQILKCEPYCHPQWNKQVVKMPQSASHRVAFDCFVDGTRQPVGYLIHKYLCGLQEEIDLRKEINLVSSLKNHYFSDMWNVHDVIVLFLLIAVVLLNLVQIAVHPNQIVIVQEHLIAVTFIPLWLKNMKYFRAFGVTAIFGIVLGKMTIDIAKFLFLYIEFFIAYGFSYWLLFGAFIVIATHVALVSILILSIFVVIVNSAFIRIQENMNASVLMQRINIIIQIEKNWCGHLHSNKLQSFIKEQCAPLEVPYRKLKYNRKVEILTSPKEVKEIEKKELLNAVWQIKVKLEDCRDIMITTTQSKIADQTSISQPHLDSSKVKMEKLQRDIAGMHQELRILDSRQKFIDEDLQSNLEQLQQNVEHICEVYHSQGHSEHGYHLNTPIALQIREDVVRKKLELSHMDLIMKSLGCFNKLSFG